MSRDTTFDPRSLTTPEYIRALYRPADNVAILVRNRGKGRTIQRIAPSERIAGPEFQGWLAAESARGFDIYIGMNPIRDGAYNRTKDSIQAIRHVYLDLDHEADDSLAMIRESASVPAPNFVLGTSPGKHQIVWNVAGFAHDEAESLLRSLADGFGGDPAATDSTRVLRLPGYANRKLADEFVVSVRQESEAVYTPRDFSIPEDWPEIPSRFADFHRRRSPTPGHQSQSERDWAYAMRSLARDDDPERIIRNIADYRATEKPDPLYYARLTVEKARAATVDRQNSANTPLSGTERPARE